MTDKTKITLIYTSVAILSALMIFGFVLLRNLKDMKADVGKNNEMAVNVGKNDQNEFLQLQKDITLTNQDGEEVSISELKDKVWVFAQFFAKCPRCAERNYTDLLALYKEYSDDPNFAIVCMSIDPETDNVERLKEYAEVVKADSKKWMFLTGDKEAMYSYMSDEMKFLDIRKRTDPAQIAAQGLYAHDMGVAVFDKDLKMSVKVDLAFARTQNEDLLKAFETKLYKTIDTALDRWKLLKLGTYSPRLSPS